MTDESTDGDLLPPAGTDRLPPAHGDSSDSPVPGDGVPPRDLSADDLTRELSSLYRTRQDTLRHGSDSALAAHDRRTGELEHEYRRRFPDREIDPRRLRHS